jgi:hypothetical protein
VEAVVVLVVAASVIRSQARKIVFSAHNSFNKCKSEEQGNKLHSSKVPRLTTEPCGVSTSSVSRICRKAKDIEISGSSFFRVT